jgi:hypothetical protein
MNEYLSMYLIRHTGLAAMIATVFLVAMAGGAWVAVYRFRIIRELRRRLEQSERQAQEFLTRIHDLTKDATDAVEGSPYRTAAPKVDGVKGEDVKPKAEEEKKPVDPDFDKEVGHFRWKGPDEFVCQACGGFESDSPRFASGKCSVSKNCEINKAHLHVGCSSCDALHLFAMMHPKRPYRSNLQPKSTKPADEPPSTPPGDEASS